MRRRIAMGLLALSVMLSVSGCTMRGSVAFTINGVITTNSQVSMVVDGCHSVVDPSQTFNVSGLVDDMIRANLAQKIAVINNVEYTDDDLLKPIQDGSLGTVLETMLPDPYCGQLALGLALEALVIFQISKPAYTAMVSQFTITVNPRFGVWNPITLAVDGSGSLSKADH